jgi:DNA-binding NarL/FixJ family response regulator
MKVLLIDSSAALADGLYPLFDDSTGFELRIVETGEEALEVHRRFHFDVAVVDLQLAGPLNGIETAERLAQIKPLHLVFSSNAYDPSVSQAALLLQPTLMLVKPVEASRLLMALQQLRDRELGHKGGAAAGRRSRSSC